MDHRLITTTLTLEGYHITAYLGTVRGISVRSRSVVGNVGAAFQMLFGGNISIYRTLCEQSREEAFNLMIEHAEQRAANAIIGVAYDANEIMNGVSEILCYGTAVKVEKIV